MQAEYGPKFAKLFGVGGPFQTNGPVVLVSLSLQPSSCFSCACSKLQHDVNFLRSAYRRRFHFSWQKTVH